MNVYIPPIIEKVYNVQGSTAAPGSGEYHRYRAMRRRERAIASAMEKEYEQRKLQKEFEVKKEMKNEILENERLKRKRRRDAKEQKIKMKKQFIKAMEEKKDIFRKDIPLIEQVKNEIGDEEFKKMCYQEEKNYDDFDYSMDNPIQNNKANNFKKGIKRNLLADHIQENKNEFIKETKLEQDEKLSKLFPKIQPKAYEFENYDDYEEHLQILDIIEKNEKIINENEIEEKAEKNENENEEVKYVEMEENIIIHDEDF